MKKFLSFVLTLCMVVSTLPAVTFGANGIDYNDETLFPDEAFRGYVKKFDTDSDGYLSQTEIDAVKTIDIQSLTQKVKDLKGLEYFTSVTRFLCNYRITDLTHLDLSKNTKLTYVDCGNTSIETIDLSKNTELTYLLCSSSKLTSIDVSKNTKLYYLDCYNTKLTSIDVSNNPELNEIRLGNTQISSLNLTKNTKLKTIGGYNLKIKNIDLSKNTQLTNCEFTDAK